VNEGSWGEKGIQGNDEISQKLEKLPHRVERHHQLGWNRKLRETEKNAHLMDGKGDKN